MGRLGLRRETLKFTIRDEKPLGIGLEFGELTRRFFDTRAWTMRGTEFPSMGESRDVQRFSIRSTYTFLISNSSLSGALYLRVRFYGVFCFPSLLFSVSIPPVY